MAELGRGSAARSYSVLLQVAGLALLLALQRCDLLASAATSTVGGSQGWDIRIDYTAWAASQTFAAGDVLLFPYDAGAHDVVEVDKAGYDACSAANAIAIHSEGDTRVTLSSAGAFYFLCSFPSHCSAGMKLAVVVGGGASAPSPITSVSPPTSTPSPSPPATPVPISAPPPSPPATPVPTPTPSVGSAPASTPTPSPANVPVPSSTPSPVNAPVPTPVSAGTPPLASTPPVSSPPSPPNIAPRLSSATSLAAALLFVSAAILAVL